MKSTYTVRYAHLREPVALAEGQHIARGTIIGAMGNTGQSTGAHLHIDVTHGKNPWMYRMRSIAQGNPEPDFQQLMYFIDEELGDGPFRVTTYPYDYRYKIGGMWKPHPAYDIVIDTPNPLIRWNRSMDGTVLKTGVDSGYGNYIYITFRA